MNAATHEDFFEKLNFTDAPKILVPPPGPKAKELIARQIKVDSNALVYPRQIPMSPERGLGATVQDVDGNYFVDFSAGIGVLNAGHSIPEIVDAVKSQVEKITHGLDFSGLPRIQLSEKLVDIAPGEMRGHSKVFLSGPTGGEAIESAIKLAKQHSGMPGIISFEGSYHGVNGSALAVTGKKSWKQKLLPVMPEVYMVPYAHCYRCPFGLAYPSCDLQCAKFLEHVIRDPDTCATSPGSLIIEPVQGEGGIVVPPDGYLQEVRRICTKYGLILIMDEIQTGFGRTGKMFSCENWGVTPDIMPVAKTVGGGLPLAGMLIREQFDTWPSGAQIGTFRGNLLSSVAGLAAINFIEKNELPARAERLGRRVIERLRQMAETSGVIGDVRGKGLFVGCEFVKDRGTKEAAPDVLQKVQKACFERGMIILKGGRFNNVARFMPALVISERLLDDGLQIFEEALRAAEGGH